MRWMNYVRDVQFVTVPKRPSVKDWEEGGSLFRAAEHGVRVLPAVVCLIWRGRVFDLVEGERMPHPCGKRRPCWRIRPGACAR